MVSPASRAPLSAPITTGPEGAPRGSSRLRRGADLLRRSRTTIAALAALLSSIGPLLAQAGSLNPFASAGKYGFKDDDGVVRIQPRYDDAGKFAESLAPVAMISGKEVYADGQYGKQCFVPTLKWGFINAAGAATIPLQYAEARGFSERLAAVRSGHRWGYIDGTGRWAIRPTFVEAGDFHAGVARVQLKESDDAGWIDKSGTLVSPAPRNRQQVSDFKDGVGLVYDLDRRSSSLIDRDGRVIAQRTDGLRLLGEGMAAYGGGSRGKIGLMDVGGRIITPQIFDAISPFANALAAVKQEGRWGFIDRTGNPVIKAGFLDTGPFNEGLANACVATDAPPERAGAATDMRCGFIDLNGRFVISPRFGRASPFEGAWASVVDPVFGQPLLVNRKGAIVERPSWRDRPTLEPEGQCQIPYPPPAPPPADYSIPFNVQSSPPGASLYLVPMWDWQTHQDGARLLADAGALSTYLVTQGRTPLASLKLKAQVYMAVFELAGQRKIARLVVAPNGPREISMSF